MGPKVQAACGFPRNTGNEAVIGALIDITKIVDGAAGTRVAAKWNRSQSRAQHFVETRDEAVVKDVEVGNSAGIHVDPEAQVSTYDSKVTFKAAPMVEKTRTAFVPLPPQERPASESPAHRWPRSRRCATPNRCTRAEPD